MENTSFQLDMTTFYSAEEAIRMLAAGCPLTSSDLHPELANLALVVATALLFDRILVPVPGLLDKGTRNGFGEKASLLARKMLELGIVQVMNIEDEELKTAARRYVADEGPVRAVKAVTFFEKLSHPSQRVLAEWAAVQLGEKSSPSGQQYNDPAANLEQEARRADFHRWTLDCADYILSALSRTDPVPFGFCSDRVRKHIVMTAVRGLVYECGCHLAGVFYLPHFVREGLLNHLSDPRVNAVAEIAGLSSDTKQVMPETTDICPKITPFMSGRIFTDFAMSRAWGIERVAGALVEERQTEDNESLRGVLRKVGDDDDRAKMISDWCRKFRRDLEVKYGRSSEGLMEGIPSAIEVIKIGLPPGVGLAAGAAAEVLKKALRAKSGRGPSGRLLFSPLYLPRYLRYLWHCVDGNYQYFVRR